MLSGEVLGKLREMAQKIAHREGCELYDLEFIGKGTNRILRVFINKQGTRVGIDDCSRVSHGLNLLLDVEDLIPGGSYHLEVSSPGLERPLRTPEHFKSAIGEKVKVKTTASLSELMASDDTNKKLANNKLLVGNLCGVNEAAIELEIASAEKNLEATKIMIPLHAIREAKVMFEFSNKQNKTKKKR